MALDSKLSSLIADIYTGASDVTVWDRAMNSIGDRLDAQFLMVAAVHRGDGSPPEARFHHVRHSRFDDAVAEYVAETHRYDPTIKHVMQHPRAGVFNSIKEVGASIYQDDPYVGWNKAMTGSMFWTAHHHGGAGDFSVGLALHRSEASGPLTGGGATELALLFDHLRNALALAARPPLIQSDEPTLLLGCDGRVMQSNEAAHRLLSGQGALIVLDGHLRARHRSSATLLDCAIRKALAGNGSHAAVCVEQECGVPLLCEVRALPASALPLESLGLAALVRIVDPTIIPEGRCDLWRSLFGLTFAEARLVQVLITGCVGLREAAVQLGVAYGTARVQLASTFTKVGVNNQSQLVQLLTRLR